MSDMGLARENAIVKGREFPRLELHGPPAPELLELARERGALEMWIGYWPEDVSYLSLFPELRLLSAGISKAGDPKPIEELENLASLDLYCFSRAKIDFGKLRQLRSFTGAWSNCTSRFYEAAALVELVISTVPAKHLSQIQQLAMLEKLNVFGSAATSLSFLRQNKRLGELRLSSLRKVADNDYLEDLTELRQLHIQACSGHSALEPLRNMIKLESLALSDVGTVDTLEPLSRCSSLRNLTLSGKTQLRDPGFEWEWFPNLERLYLPGMKEVWKRGADQLL